MTPSDASSPLNRPSAGPAAAPSDASRLVAQRLRARERRVSVIRRRVVAIALAVFLALWSVIFLQLVSGNDPALSRRTATTTAAVASIARVTATSGSTTSSGSTAENSGLAAAKSRPKMRSPAIGWQANAWTTKARMRKILIG